MVWWSMCYRFRSGGKPISTQVSSAVGGLMPRVTQLNLRCHDINSVTLQSYAILPCDILSLIKKQIFFFIKACYRQLKNSYPCPVALKDNGTSVSEIL